MKTLIRLTLIVLVVSAGQAFAQKSAEVNTVMYECSFDCPSCEEKVMKNIAYEKGVKSVVVNYDAKQVVVSYKTGKNTDDGIKSALEKLGYETKVLGQATSFEVKGNCGMCKNKIENSALSVNGVSAASWDVENHQLTLAYEAEKTSLVQIHQAIADSGYDTGKVRARDEVYDQLHHCCKYDR